MSDEEEYPLNLPDFDWVRPVSFVSPTKLPPLQFENSIFNSADYSVYLSDSFCVCEIVLINFMTSNFGFIG